MYESYKSGDVEEHTPVHPEKTLAIIKAIVVRTTRSFRFYLIRRGLLQKPRKNAPNFRGVFASRYEEQ
jgi:hypothetical protein